MTRPAENTSDGLEVHWSNAGHPPSMLVRSDGSPELSETEPDLLLGFDLDTARHDHHVSLPPGTTLVLYTDGLIERRRAPISEGLDWLADVLRTTTSTRSS